MRGGHKQVPPPEQFTLADRYKIVLGALAVVLGLVILIQVLTVPGALSPPGILAGLAFVGFGAYRLWTARTRLQQYRARSAGDR